MKSKNNKSFILIRVLQCGCVNVHAAVEACAHGMFQTGLVDSAAATFITAWENVMR